MVSSSAQFNVQEIQQPAPEPMPEPTPEPTPQPEPVPQPTPTPTPQIGAVTITFKKASFDPTTSIVGNLAITATYTVRADLLPFGLTQRARVQGTGLDKTKAPITLTVIQDNAQFFFNNLRRHTAYFIEFFAIETRTGTVLDAKTFDVTTI